MSPAAYSVPYVAGWADDLDVLRHHMSTVVTTSQWILGDLEGPSSASHGRQRDGALRPEFDEVSRVRHSAQSLGEC